MKNLRRFKILALGLLAWYACSSSRSPIVGEWRLEDKTGIIADGSRERIDHLSGSLVLKQDGSFADLNGTMIERGTYRVDSNDLTYVITETTNDGAKVDQPALMLHLKVNVVGSTLVLTLPPTQGRYTKIEYTYRRAP